MINESPYRRLARQRTELHDKVGRTDRTTKQVLDSRDLVGVIAEGEYAQMMAYRMDTELYPGGDEGYDFISPKGKKIDIKATERRQGRLMIKRDIKRPHADVYVLAIVNVRSETAIFPGYLLKKDLPSCKQEYHQGEVFYVANQSQLRKFEF